jgi:hypothetical protein
MTRWLARIAFAGTIAFAAVGIAVSAIQDWPTGSSPFIYGTLATVFATVGWMIAERRPGNRIGPILLLFGLGWAAYLPADALLRLPEPIPGSAFIAATVQCLDVTSFTLLALALLFFPDGRPYSPRWRWVVPAGVLIIAMDAVGVWLDSAPVILFPAYRSPFGIAGFPAQVLVLLSYVGMLGLYVLAVVSLARRWRRGQSLERAQIKWIAAAAAVALVGELVNVLTFDPADPNGLLAILASFTITLIPLAIGIAILRYRLFEIDRIISRTITYAALSAILAMVFVGIILVLQAVLDPFTQGQTVAVAASTLVVFALFQPVRRRVQHAVDRRFDRARIDADRTSAAFADRLRHEVDMATVTADLAGTASAALAPASLAVWIREP